MDIFLLVKEMDRLIDRTATCLHIILKCFYVITNHSCSRYRTPNTYKDLVFVNEQIMVREGVIRFYRFMHVLLKIQREQQNRNFSHHQSSLTMQIEKAFESADMEDFLWGAKV